MSWFQNPNLEEEKEIEIKTKSGFSAITSFFERPMLEGLYKHYSDEWIPLAFTSVIYDVRGY